MLHRMRDSGILGERSIAPWVRALAAALSLLGACLGAAQAQVATEFSAGITAGVAPHGITAGPDGNLWFTEYFGNRIGRITPAGVVTEFSTGIAAGPDSNLWFTEFIVGNRIGRITTGAVIAPPTSIPSLQQWALWLLGLLVLIVTADMRLRQCKKH